MREENLKNVRKRSKYRSYKGEIGKVAPNILNRDFTTTGPDQKWATDVTQINIGMDKCYLSPVLDMYNGEIVSYTISDHPDLKMVMDMLGKAFAKGRTRRGLILHSDQGWHYQHAIYQKSLVLKFASNDFTFPGKIRVWQRTVEEYRALGYYCPRIFCDKSGGFPLIVFRGRICCVHAEEFSKYRSLEERCAADEDRMAEEYDRYLEDIWTMTAKIAARRLDYTRYPSAYCLFETFCPSDKVDEVLENALQWKALAEALPGEFSEQARRIWRLWSGNREALQECYRRLPTSVFQADLNATNLLIDGDGGFRGVYDFNLCGREVFLNYLMRENNSETIPQALRIAGKYYRFSEEEKQAALPLFRCLDI